MAWPYDPLTIPYFSPGYVDAPDLDTLIAAKLNSLRAAVPFGFIGEDNDTGNVTLSTVTDLLGLAVFTFVLPTQRRVRVVAQSSFAPNAASATARYRLRTGYNSGATAVIGSFVQVGQPFDMPDTSANPGSAVAEGTALLAAGTYTAYGVVRRSNGGAATDVANNHYVAVYDVGGI